MDTVVKTDVKIKVELDGTTNSSSIATSTGISACSASDDAANLALPFFVDRTGCADVSGSVFEVSDPTRNCSSSSTVFEVADPSRSSSSTVVEFAKTGTASAASDAAKMLPSEQTPTTSRQRRKKRKKCWQNDGGSGAGSIGDMIGSAKRRVIDQLRQLAGSEDSSAASRGEMADSAAVAEASREMRYLQSINDQLAAAISERVPADDADSDDNDGNSISLGVKATAHHAPAFNRVHRRDLTEFLVDMRSDKDLWQVDPDDLLPRQQQRITSPVRPVDPMQAECSVCLKRGHLNDQCSRTGPVCIFCGREGHPKASCPDRLCPLCLASGHSAEACHRYGLLTREPCDRCGALGHLRDQCPDIWRQYHSTVSPGCQPMSKEVDYDREQQEEEAAAESSEPSDSLRVDSLVGQVSPFSYCCNCAQRGHSVHQCSQPAGSLNKFIGSVHSQLVCRYDLTEKFSPDRLQLAAAAAAAAGTSAGSGTGNYCDRSDQDLKTDNLPVTSQSMSCQTPATRPAAQIGESFVPLFPRHHATPSFRAELDQLRAMARRLLPEGTSKSQVKKLANRLRYWRRHGYQPSTPEEEAQMTQRMEAWVLEVADSHNYLHKLNFKRRCRLLNSTGAALEVIRSCRQFSDSPPAASATRADATPRQRKRWPNRQRQQQQEEPKVQLKKRPAKRISGAAAEASVWSGRLRSRCTQQQQGEGSSVA